MNHFNIIYYLREFYTTYVNYLREQHIKIYIRVKKSPRISPGTLLAHSYFVFTFVPSFTLRFGD